MRLDVLFERVFHVAAEIDGRVAVALSFDLGPKFSCLRNQLAGLVKVASVCGPDGVC